MYSEELLMNKNPVIIVPGLGRSKLVLCDDAGNKIKNAWPFELDTKAILDELKGSLMKLMLFRKDAGFSDRIADIVREVAEPLALNSDGTKKNNIKADEFRKPVSECSAEEKSFIYKAVPVDMFGEKLSEDRLFYFAYDFLGDIGELAASLDSFISFVKEKTGSEKVDLLVVSTAGSVFKAYLKDYSVKSDIGKAVCVAATLDGASLVADIYENKLNLSNPMSLLSSVGGKAATLSQMAGMIPEEVINNVISKSIDVIKTLILDNCTALWALVPSSETENALSAANVNDVLREKVRELASFDFATYLAENEVYAVGGCGKTLPPVAASSDIDCDGLVDTASVTYGVSSEKVWLYRNQTHDSILYNDSVMSLVLKILCGEDVAEYPRENGARNVKKLKNELIPKIEADENAKAFVEEYKNMLGAVIITDDSQVKELENKIESMNS